MGCQFPSVLVQSDNIIRMTALIMVWYGTVPWYCSIMERRSKISVDILRTEIISHLYLYFMAENPQFVYFPTTTPQNCTPAKKTNEV